MPTYTNKDLTQKLLISDKSRVYTNADTKKYEFHPPDVMDDGTTDNEPSPPDVLDDEWQGPEQTVSNAKPIDSNEPGDYASGFANSVMSGEALGAGWEGLKGFAKGAIADIPSSISNVLESGYDFADKFVHNPKEAIKSIPRSFVNMEKGIGNTVKYAGSDEGASNFGEMMGQMTGQPAVLGTLPKTVPPVIRGAGAIASGTGKVLQNYPITDFVPGGRFVVPPAIRRMDRNVLSGAMGRGLENVGERMRGVGKNSIKQGEIVSEDLPDIQDGEIIPPAGPKQLPPSKTSFYGTEKNPNPIITPDPGVMKQLPPSNTHYMGPSSRMEPKTYKVIRNGDGQNLSSDVLQEGQELPISTKRKVRTNNDGTFTDMNTGEILDSKGQNIIEMNGKSIDKNSPFFKKNKTSESYPPNSFKSTKLPYLDPQTMKPKNYFNVLLESPNGTRLTVGELIKQTGSKIAPEAILQEMGEGRGLQKYGYKIIG